jgi:enoyl-CoA hydratase/carnithine racemase
MVLTGMPIDAARAAQAGLLNALVAEGEALTAAVELAQRVCESAPLAVQASLEAMQAVEWEAEEAG